MNCCLTVSPLCPRWAQVQSCASGVQALIDAQRLIEHGDKQLSEEDLRSLVRQLIEDVDSRDRVAFRGAQYDRGLAWVRFPVGKGGLGLRPEAQTVVNDEIRDLISGGASTDQLRAACRKHGMQTLREAGMKALYDGRTTIEEIVRETVLEDEF